MRLCVKARIFLFDICVRPEHVHLVFLLFRLTMSHGSKVQHLCPKWYTVTLEGCSKFLQNEFAKTEYRQIDLTDQARGKLLYVQTRELCPDFV